jgi:hypothetical protein
LLTTAVRLVFVLAISDVGGVVLKATEITCVGVTGVVGVVVCVVIPPLDRPLRNMTVPPQPVKTVPTHNPKAMQTVEIVLRKLMMLLGDSIW